MTRRDYVAIAAELADARRYSDHPEQRLGIDAAAERIADTLARDNPRFDRKRFLAACGVSQ